MLRPQLKTFLTVCRSGSFSKAAAALYITPSAVIQQINALEKELGSELFIRGSRGVTLTRSGEYLFTQGDELQTRSEEIRRHLQALSSMGNEICVGTSLLEKCRLLYNLWMLFSQEEPAYEITMVNIDAGHQVPEKADLVESVNGGVPWTRDWEFMEICQVPFGFAFRRDHPLARKQIIEPEDLRGEIIISVNQGTSSQIMDMLETLRSHGVRVSCHPEAAASILWESSFHNHALVVPLCWGDILINMELRPCRWDKSIPYGIFHRPVPSPAAERFLDFIRLSYADVDLEDIFPYPE